jgi:serine/threonine protein kinase
LNFLIGILILLLLTIPYNNYYFNIYCRLYQLPRLSWIAFGGNPISTIMSNNDNNIEIIDWNSITLYEKLGEGASGVVHKGIWKNNDEEISVAVKLFKGIATSDGLPEDEMKASIHTGNHPNSTKVYGKLVNCPMGLGLILDLIGPTFKILGMPPSFDSITRDIYPEEFQIELNHALSILKGIASVCCHLHSRGISHGDLYAHNILVYEGKSLLSDFGAASFYNPSSGHAKSIEGIEVRAFGCLLEELINLTLKNSSVQSNEIIMKLQDLQLQCTGENPLARPSFNSVLNYLDCLI